MPAQPSKKTLSFYVDTPASFFANGFTLETPKQTARQDSLLRQSSAGCSGWMPAHSKKT
jgi:hypothetical protein